MAYTDAPLAIGMLGLFLTGAKIVYDQRQHAIDRATTNALLTEIRDEIRSRGAVG